jgi:hypothetical protein
MKGLTMLIDFICGKSGYAIIRCEKYTKEQLYLMFGNIPDSCECEFPIEICDMQGCRCLTCGKPIGK